MATVRVAGVEAASSTALVRVAGIAAVSTAGVPALVRVAGVTARSTDQDAQVRVAGVFATAGDSPWFRLTLSGWDQQMTVLSL